MFSFQSMHCWAGAKSNRKKRSAGIAGLSGRALRRGSAAHRRIPIALCALKTRDEKRRKGRVPLSERLHTDLPGAETDGLDTPCATSEREPASIPSQISIKYHPRGCVRATAIENGEGRRRRKVVGSLVDLPVSCGSPCLQIQASSVLNPWYATAPQGRMISTRPPSLRIPAHSSLRRVFDFETRCRLLETSRGSIVSRHMDHILPYSTYCIARYGTCLEGGNSISIHKSHSFSNF